MPDSSLFGRTTQPVIAERRLVRADGREPVVVRIHAPEPGGSHPMMPWQCGFDIVGLPEIWELYDVRPGPGEIFLTDGVDSFDALRGALRDVRGVLDFFAEEVGVELTFTEGFFGGHEVPTQVDITFGPAGEQELLAVMKPVSLRLMAELGQRHREEARARHDRGSGDAAEGERT